MVDVNNCEDRQCEFTGLLSGLDSFRGCTVTAMIACLMVLETITKIGVLACAAASELRQFVEELHIGL